MKRSIKILLGVILGLVAVLALFLTRGDFVQGLMRPAYDVNKCYDSDGGQKYDVKGTTYGKVGTRDKQTQYTDSCKGDTLVEYYCSGKYVKSEKYPCENGCSDGACEESTAGSLSTLISKDCNGKCKALVFVENGIFAPLEDSLNTWKKDIEKEFNADVIFIPVEENVTAENIKDTIWSHEKPGNGGSDVFVVLLVGDVPYLNAYTSDDNDQDLIIEGFFPSDVLFTDGKDRCPYNLELAAYNTNGNFGCQYIIDEWPFVIGRLKPYGDISTRTSLLEDYFARNHQHRTSSNNYGIGNGELLVNITNFDGVSDGDELITTEEERLEWLLSPDKYTILSPLTETDDSNYLAELQNNYSIAYYNGHGSPNWQEYNITSEIIEQTVPSALYYSLKSCNVGNISWIVNKSLASAYLFYGQGLFVYSVSTPVFAGHPIYKDIYYPLSGVPIYKFYSKVIEGNYVPSTILMGDPTISIRKQNKNIPDIKFSLGNLDFGKISLEDFNGDVFIKEYKMQIENNSNKPIFIDTNPWPKFTGDSYGDPNTIHIVPKFKIGYSQSEIDEPFSANYGVKLNANANGDGTILLAVEEAGILSEDNPYKKFKGNLTIPIYSEEFDQIYFADLPFEGEIVQ